ncbi:MAG TPA: FAD-dependent oxidoreductase, partial [Armatimonadota bacterium]|nr:FAD-dependent oxidoreductase [Armatimonadota bacterium]
TRMKGIDGPAYPYILRSHLETAEGVAMQVLMPSDETITMARFVGITRTVQDAFPDLAVVGSGYSWVRQFYPQVAAAVIAQGWATLVGLGRGALAYPDFARDILETGRMEATKTCVTCSACTQIMRDGGRSGCVVRDAEVYGPIYREGRRLSADHARALAQQCRLCATPTCRDHCPAGVDIPGFLGQIAEGDDRGAYAVLHAANPLPEICAHVCPVEVQCESGCVEAIFTGRPVPIKQLQKYVAALARKQGWTTLALPAATGQRAAIIGAGPAGVACAVRLLELGCRVTIFAAAEAGGVAGATIPAERLPHDVLRAEIAAVLDLDADPSRLTWKAGTPLTASFTLDDVLTDGYDAVFIGIGLPRSQRLDAPRPASGVMDGLDFLREAKLGMLAVPQRVAVIGGGNTAMDAAVTARALGAEDVYVLYRRSFNELPAWPEERAHALDAGVNVLIFTQPVGYVADAAGALAGVQVRRTTLGAPDASGRRRPEPVPGSDYVLEVDLAVEAIGQLPPADLPALLPGVNLTTDGLIAVEPGSARTSRDRVYAGGDLVNGGKTVVDAVRSGVQAAEEMARAALASPPR